MTVRVHRTVAIENRTPEAKAKDELEFSFSSETPVERWWGNEILSHDAKAIDFGRLDDGRHPFLVGHNTDNQVGVVNHAWLDEEAKKARCGVRWSRSSYAKEIRQDVDDEIRTLVSVGYLVHEVIERTTKRDGAVVERTLTGAEFLRELKRKFGDDFDFDRAGPMVSRESDESPDQGPPTYIVTRWEPFEVSIVPIPADVEVGVGRSAVPEQPEPKSPAAPAATVVHTQRSNPTMDPKDKTPADLERDRVNSILDLSRQYEKFVDAKAASEAVRNNTSVEQFKDTILKAMESTHSDTRSSPATLGLEAKDKQRYSIARAIAASITGDWRGAGLERACSEAVAKVLGRGPDGFYMPYDAFHRDFTVATAGEAGNLVPTELRGDMFADVLRNNMVMSKLGVRMLFGLTSNLDIPKKTVAGTISRVTEIAALTETNPTTAKVSLTPKRMGAFTEYSKQSIIQSALAVEPLIRQDLIDGIAVDLQDAWLNGSGAGANIRGLRNTSGVGSVVGGANGLAPTWGHFVDLESACANVNAEPDKFSGYLINTKARGFAKKTQKAANLLFIWDNGAQPLNGYRAEVSNSVPSNLVKGASGAVCSSIGFGSDWSQSIVGFFGAPDIVVDPFTLATTGMVRITMQQFADHAARLAACFSFMDDALCG